MFGLTRHAYIIGYVDAAPKITQTVKGSPFCLIKVRNIDGFYSKTQDKHIKQETIIPILAYDQKAIQFHENCEVGSLCVFMAKINGGFSKVTDKTSLVVKSRYFLDLQLLGWKVIRRGFEIRDEDYEYSTRKDMQSSYEQEYSAIPWQFEGIDD